MQELKVNALINWNKIIFSTDHDYGEEFQEQSNRLEHALLETSRKEQQKQSALSIREDVDLIVVLGVLVRGAQAKFYKQ